MTAITQAKAVMEGLAGKTLTNEVMLSVVQNYVGHSWVIQVDIDTYAVPTNEELAQQFIDLMLVQAKKQVRAGATKKEQTDNYAVVLAAGNASIADL